MNADKPVLRIAARVLLMDTADRVLLIHGHDPDDPAYRWWALPGGGQEAGETLRDTARRELAEETRLLATRDRHPLVGPREPVPLPQPGPP